MASFPEHLTTERLSLHRWDAALHTAGLARVNAEPAAVRFLNDSVPYTLEDSRRQSERFAEHWTLHGFGLWAMELDGAIVGFTGACHPAWFPAYAHEVELGWRLHPSVWGRGYATEAGHAARDAAFTRLELSRLIACIDPANTPSISVATRLGLTLDTTVEHPQRPGSVSIYAISAGRTSRTPS
jgi:RimJ/RimL family protein N-acetyltransferase